MPLHRLMRLLAIALCCAGAIHASAASRSTHQEQLSTVPFVEGRPSQADAQTLRDELLFQRATQSYLWALPLINTLGMKTGSEAKFGAGYHVLPIWKQRLDARTRITTPNSDVIYAMSYVDLGKDGPLVFEAPPRLQGILLDFWQRPIPGPEINGKAFLGDVGFFGPDAGTGGKFLLLPPGYAGPVPEGHYVFRSTTNNVFIFLRAFYQDPKNLKPAVALMEQAKIYPLNNREGAKAMQFPDASGVPVDMLPPSDGRAFEQLQALLDSEGASLADPDWLGMLAAIGLVKGQAFTPDARQRAILDRAAKTAYKMSRVIGFEDKVGGISYRVFPDRRWLNPFADGSPANPGGAKNLSWHNVAGASAHLDLDARIWMFTEAYSISPGMISQVPGKGAKYMLAFVDSSGAPLSGGKGYRLHLPANIPAANFWSVTLYDADNASGLANGQAFPSLGSRDQPVQNADGSTDIYFAPKVTAVPQGKRGNWLTTVPGKGYFAIIRLYGPTQAGLDNTWKPEDIEKQK